MMLDYFNFAIKSVRIKVMNLRKIEIQSKKVEINR